MIGIGITDALDDRNHPLVVERFERTHAGIEADVRVDRQDVAAGDCKSRTHLIVASVAVRHDAVEPVVAAVEVDQHQDSGLGCRAIPAAASARARARRRAR